MAGARSSPRVPKAPIAKSTHAPSGGPMNRPARPRMLRGRKPARTLRASAAAPAASTDRFRAESLGSPVPMNTLPAEVTRPAQREMDRLRRLPPGTPEAGHVRAYLQWLWSLPWERSAPEDADLRKVQRILERDHLALDKAKQRVVEYLAVRRLK